MILVSGCSWACGEWVRGDIQVDTSLGSIVHEGFSHYIEENIDSCVNLGIPGGSNLQAAHKIQGWLSRHPSTKVNKIFIFQTEYCRDLRMKFDEDYVKIDEFVLFPNIIISRFYSRCVEISQRAGCPVFLIGGVSDTLKFDNFEKEYPGVKIACQSMTNLLVNDDENVEIPVLSWYGSRTVDLIESIKQKLSPDQLAQCMIEIDRGLERESLVFSHPEYFWPDGRHVNRVGYQKLFDFLCKKGILT